MRFIAILLIVAVTGCSDATDDPAKADKGQIITLTIGGGNHEFTNAELKFGPDPSGSGFRVTLTAKDGSADGLLMYWTTDTGFEELKGESLTEPDYSVDDNPDRLPMDKEDNPNRLHLHKKLIQGYHMKATVLGADPHSMSLNLDCAFLTFTESEEGDVTGKPARVTGRINLPLKK